MSTQLLIYENAVPVTNQRHGNWSVKVGNDYGFARGINSVPLTAVEFPAAAAEYPIVFAGSADAVMPAVLLGVRANENLYVSKEGAWQAKYLPAFVRRYPFVFSREDDGKTFTLCIDESFSGCNQEGVGARLFGDDGKPTPYVDKVMDFLKTYQTEFDRTQKFCAKLKEHDLLEPMQAEFTIGDGRRLSLTGFMAVNRERLKKLSGETLAALAKTDELELLYLHLHSMDKFNALKDRVVVAQSTVAPAQSAAATASTAGVRERKGKASTGKTPSQPGGDPKPG